MTTTTNTSSTTTPTSTTTTCASTARGTRYRYTTQLGREWEYVRLRPRHLAEARRWRTSITAGALADVLDGRTGPFRDLEQILQVTNAADPRSERAERADRALLDLVELAHRNQLAGRIVIQRILPGLVSRSARYRGTHDGTDPAETVVPAAWIAIADYDTVRRRHHVAASLISDATFQAFRRPMRLRSSTEVVTATAEFEQCCAPTESATPLEELAGVLRLARAHGVSEVHLDVVRELAQKGSTSAVAATHGVTARTVRNRRDRAVEGIREALAA